MTYIWQFQFTTGQTDRHMNGRAYTSLEAQKGQRRRYHHHSLLHIYIGKQLHIHAYDNVCSNRKKIKFVNAISFYAIFWQYLHHIFFVGAGGDSFLLFSAVKLKLGSLWVLCVLGMLWPEGSFAHCSLSPIFFLAGCLWWLVPKTSIQLARMRMVVALVGTFAPCSKCCLRTFFGLPFFIWNFLFCSFYSVNAHWAYKIPFNLSYLFI